MRNLARATATAGLAVAFGIVAMPTASAAVHDAAPAAKAKSGTSAKTSASAKKAAQKAAVDKAVARALAKNRPVTVNVYYVMHDGRVVSEQGPGNNAAHEVHASAPVGMQTQNEPITTGDLSAEKAEGPVNFEVEGSEQDTGEVS